jgi:phage gpG-like protein
MLVPTISSSQSLVGCPPAGELALRARKSAMRWLLAAAALSLVVGAALWVILIGQGGSAAPAVRTPTSAHSRGFAGLSFAAQGQISAALGADEHAYRVSSTAGGFTASNPGQSLRARFGRSGIVVSSRGSEVGLGLRAVGYGNSLTPVGEVTPTAKANRVTYAHAGLSEWYANGPLGLEQGFTILRPLSSQQAGPLTLSITLSGDARAFLAHSDGGVVFGRAGAPSLRYSGLAASDAGQHRLHAWLQLRDQKLLLRVDASGARYPLRIDPLIQQAKLTGSTQLCEGNAGCRFGSRVALSADGNTALIGAQHEDKGIGAAWVFTRDGATWTQQAKLTGSEELSAGRFGGSVSLSADGNTALIGGPGDKNGWGAAWVFTREGTTWSQQAKLVGSEINHSVFFGFSVSLSADGSTALVGAPSDNGRLGAAWVFTREGATWAQQGPKLTGMEELGEGHLGRSVALSADGNTALIGGNTDGGGVGAAWVFTREGAIWRQQGPKLTGSEELGAGRFGFSVALSADGNTALIGGYADKKGKGAAWAFTREGSAWIQQGPKLTGKEESYQSWFGYSIALSPDAKAALIGGPRDDKGLGGAWFLTREGTTWAQQGAKLTGTEELGEGRFGTSVAISADANTALIGGDQDDDWVGAAWVFVGQSFIGQPTVTGLEPKLGPVQGGTSVTITGTNFAAGNTSVSFGSYAAASVSVSSSTSLVAVSPAEPAEKVDVRVTTPAGTSPSSKTDRFTFHPTVTGLDPGSGPAEGGTRVILTGTGFALGNNATVVRFGDTKATSVNCVSSLECIATSPAGNGTVKVTVTVNSITSVKGAKFSYF